MPTKQPPDRMTVEMAEWQQIGPEQNENLRNATFVGNPAAQRLIGELRGRVDIREGYAGLEITSTSYVGRIEVAGLRIGIIPKLAADPLTRLLRYAYELRDIEVGANEQTRTPSSRQGLQDLFIRMLISEAEELLHRGLARRYMPHLSVLVTPRGRIAVDRLAYAGGLFAASLPCRHFERTTEWFLNRVVGAGLCLAARMANDRDLRRRAFRLGCAFDSDAMAAVLTVGDISKAERELTRLTNSYGPALAIVRLLHAMLGLSLGLRANEIRTPCFLFDMNTFFQRLLSRFLNENLRSVIADERPIRDLLKFAADANPQKRIAPAPRPDFTVFDGRQLTGFLDAKYRDVWTLWLPAEWLYQLSMYALAAPKHTSILLYATAHAAACDQRIEIGAQPGFGQNSASVIIRPVLLHQLADLVGAGPSAELARNRANFARGLISPLASANFSTIAMQA